MVRILMLVLSLCLLLAACGSDDAVATVNGEDIPFQAVQNLQYDSETELTTAEYVELLDVYIAWTVFTQEARDQFGVDPTEEEIQAEVTKILFESGAATQESFLETQNLSVTGLQLTATQFLIEAGLEAALAPAVPEIPMAEAEAAFSEFPGDFAQICLAHILLATEAEATDVVAQLSAGADFADLAAALSQDSTSAPVGGDLGCAPASQFIPEFGDAGLVEPVGEVFGPLQTDFGFHVMVVVSRMVPTVADVLTDLQAAAVFDEIDAWYIDVLGRAEVTVDPTYGVWQSGSTARLVPPTG